MKDFNRNTSLPSPPSVLKPRTLLYHMIASSMFLVSVTSSELFSSRPSRTEIRNNIYKLRAKVKLLTQ